jgi:hypothetical protein
VARKRDLASKLSQSSERRPGWRDAITGPAQEGPPQRPQAQQEEEEESPSKPKRRTSRLQRKTYLLTPGLIDQIATLADEEQVGINELVRYLLRSSLQMVEEGELPIPTRPATREIVRGE